MHCSGCNAPSSGLEAIEGFFSIEKGVNSLVYLHGSLLACLCSICGLILRRVGRWCGVRWSCCDGYTSPTFLWRFKAAVDRYLIKHYFRTSIQRTLIVSKHLAQLTHIFQVSRVTDLDYCRELE